MNAIFRILAAAGGMLVAAQALAHPGHPGGGVLGADLWHLLTEPDHLALLVGVPVAIALAVRYLRPRRGARGERRDARGPRRAQPPRD